jgi:hypothetical protein
MAVRHVDIAKYDWPFINSQHGAAVAPVDDFGISFRSNIHQEHSGAKIDDVTRELDPSGALRDKDAFITGGELSAQVSARPV